MATKKPKTKQQKIEELQRQLAALNASAGKSGGKPGKPKKKPLPPPPPPGIPGAPKAPAPTPPPPPTSGLPGAPKQEPPQGQPGAPKAEPAPGVPGIPKFTPPPVPSFTPPRPPGHARPTLARRAQSGVDYPSGVFPGGTPKIQPGMAPPPAFAIPPMPPTTRTQAGHPRGQGTATLANSQRPGLVGSMTNRFLYNLLPRGTMADPGPIQWPTRNRLRSWGNALVRFGVNQGMLPADVLNAGRPAPVYGPALPPGYKPRPQFPDPVGSGQQPLEVTADGTVLTKRHFAEAARWSGLAILEAVNTGDLNKLPNRMHWRTVKELPTPPGYESIEKFMEALGYKVDADGNWTHYRPTTVQGYGGGGAGAYGTQSSEWADYGDYGGGWGGWGDGGGVARGYGGKVGLVNWRIG